MHEETVGSKIVKWVLIGVSVLFLVVMLLLPLATVISETGLSWIAASNNRLPIPFP